MKILSIVTAIIIVIVSTIAWLAIPEFNALFQGFGADLPILTRFTLDSYRYWLLLLIIPVITFIILLVEHDISERAIGHIRIILILTLVGSALLFILAGISMYLPIFQMGRVL